MRWGSLFCAFYLAAQVPLFPWEREAPPAFFSIDPSTRTTQLIDLLQRLQKQPFSAQSTYEISLITQINGVQGFVPFLNNLVLPTAPPPLASAGVFKTLLIAWYRTTPGGASAQNKYLVLFIEQILQMVYSTQTISSSSVQAPVHALATLPYYPINPVERALDIQAAVYTLNSLQPYNLHGAAPNVSLTTTLRGTYNGAELQNGVIPFVRMVQPYGTMMIITYQLSATNNVAQYIVLSSDQVVAINYTKNSQ
ncbi:MAG: hypothetical protein KGI80_02350 [Verrucomicrobiota bacterium]|nr:hypothetical protein [Verrucomicrobiota bacterium]